ncbi:type II toxin-antitoxin system HicB family antitoxin [Pantoea ananatis]|uniref:type II toxin-antitoxin system HicB family antitoxin n=1 Tax=Pantoea ananas TaxID=553 RepID=UPI001FF379FD|nr:type II toxin-antitoxin system HicB family antitoxin [Pantoea ananatis]MCK0554445.1 type II toxin-antitoxin system HicB family antitoxin [Pantoea ananatis]
MRFPVYLHKADTDGYSGFVPDITGCFFAGDTIDDAIVDATEAIDAHLESLADRGKDLPEAKGIEVHIENEDCQNGIWAYVDIDVSKYDGKAVKLNITLPQNLLVRIDNFVELHKEYNSRSGFLADLARKELTKV